MIVDRLLDPRLQTPKEDYLLTHLELLPCIREWAAELTEQQQERDKQRYDKRHVDRKFQAGDAVMLSIPRSQGTGLSCRLNPRYCGPFTIIRKVGSNDYEIEGTSARMKNVVNVARLKRFEERQAMKEHTDPGDNDDDTEEEEDDDLSEPASEAMEQIPENMGDKLAVMVYEQAQQPRRSGRIRRGIVCLCLLAADFDAQQTGQPIQHLNE